MSIIELHPEQLLERERQGELGEGEREMLDAHLETCAACRLLRAATDDFAAERAELDVDAELASRLVPDAVSQLRADLDEAADEALPRVGTGRSWRRAAIIAAAVLTAGSAAATTGWIGGLWSADEPEPAPAPPVSAPAESEGEPTGVGRLPAPPPASPADTAAEPEVEPPSPDEPSAESPAAPPRGAHSTALAPPPTPDASEGGAAPEAAGPSPAAQLFGEGSRALAAGDYERAQQLYRELQRRYPSSPEARSSRAIVARMLLDHGEPEAALRDYDRYLAEGRGALTEEAMVGRALAFQRLGRAGAERAAWQALLRQYPDSVHGRRARARLQALSER